MSTLIALWQDRTNLCHGIKERRSGVHHRLESIVEHLRLQNFPNCHCKQSWTIKCDQTGALMVWLAAAAS